jgi:lycopene beta-cyclase
MPTPDADLILVGGGLANGLIAWRLRTTRPDLRLMVLEQDASIGGNHTWSFHPTDLSAEEAAWIAPLVDHRWNGHEVIFPQRRRRLAGGYASITSDRAVLGTRLRTNTAVRRVASTEVELADGRVLRAGAVIDGRGPRDSASLELGYQKFLGQELRLTRPHGLECPVLMDASVAQHDGYRFIYVLPLAPDRLLIEDTFYADGPAFDEARLRRNIADYAALRGWSVAEVVREERGVLPIVLSGDPHAFWNEAAGVARSGLAAGLFHPTTGYSLPDAVALAVRIADLPDLSAGPLFDAVRLHALRRWRSRGFFRLLNRMLFRAAEPSLRWKVMQRFYGLPEPLVARFYAARLHALDKLRIVSGKPPVPLLAAVKAALDRPFTASSGRADSASQP